MGSGLSTELGTGLARIGPVAHIVHGYIGDTTIILALNGNQHADSVILACATDIDVLAYRMYKLPSYQMARVLATFVACNNSNTRLCEFALVCIRDAGDELQRNAHKMTVHEIAASKTHLKFFSAKI